MQKTFFVAQIVTAAGRKKTQTLWKLCISNVACAPFVHCCTLYSCIHSQNSGIGPFSAVKNCENTKHITKFQFILFSANACSPYNMGSVHMHDEMHEKIAIIYVGDDFINVCSSMTSYKCFNGVSRALALVTCTKIMATTKKSAVKKAQENFVLSIHYSKCKCHFLVCCDWLISVANQIQ